MPTVEALDRLVDKIVVDESCWEWQGAHARGYAHCVVDGKTKMAHRMVYEWLIGPIPSGLTLDHLCRNRGCVNPAHLEPVTMTENIRRGTSPTAKNAAKTHCARGHEFTPENTITRRRGHLVERWCRTCTNVRSREWSRRYRQEKKK